MPDELSYVYAVGRDVPDAAVTGLSGVGGRPVRLVARAGLAAVVGSVDAVEFAPGAVEENMRDLGWISATARAHHDVVDGVGARAVIAPFALGTVYLDDTRVRDVLSERRAAFGPVLDRLDGRAEWGLKAWAPDAPAPARTGRAASGADYLRRRRAALHDAERETDVAHDAAEKVHAVAAAGADAARRHRLHEPALSGRPEPMVLNGAYLVDRAGTDRWRSEVDRAAVASGLVVEVTGPWVPYSFAEVGTP